MPHIAYEPKTRGAWQQPVFSEPLLATIGSAGHWNHRSDDDYHSQLGALFRRMDAERQKQLFENTALAMAGVSDQVCQRHVANCAQAGPAYDAGATAGLTSNHPDKIIY